jgi:RNA polymerase sigma-70 factor (ECF subfamily)
MLSAYLRTLVGRDPIADDLFQETMIVAWKRLADYDRSRSFAPWLRGIARVLVLEHSRRGRARPATVDPDVLTAIDARFELLGRAPGDTFMERAERILQCMGRLPAAMKEAVELVYARGLSLAAAAESLGQSKDAVMKRVQRGRRLLAECLGIGEGAG